MDVNDFQKSLLIFFILTLSISVFCQVDTTWLAVEIFPDDGSIAAYSVETDQNGNVIIAGVKGDDTPPIDIIFVAKIDDSGQLVWSNTVSYPELHPFGPYDLCIDQLGNPYIAYIKPEVPWSLIVRKYAAEDGAFLWESEIPNASFNGFEWQVRSEYMICDDDFVYVAGTRFIPEKTSSSMLLSKLTYEGDTVWTSTHAGSGIYSNSKSIALDNEGNVYLAGDVWNASIDYCVVKFDPDGNKLWYAYYDGEIYHDTDIPQKVLVDDDGYIFITGYNQVTSTTKDIVTVKYNQEGEFQWARSYGNPEYRHSSAYFLAKDSNDDLYVGGYSAYEDPYPGTGKDYILLKYNNNGDLLWEARYDQYNYIDDHPHDFEMGPDENIYVCGTSIKPCFPDEFMTVVKYNQLGQMVWDICIPELYGIPWEISVQAENEFVIAGQRRDSNYVSSASIMKFTEAPPANYDANITDFYFESQLVPPEINYANHTVYCTVHDTADLNFLVPYVSVSDYACFYPEDGDTTSFVEPVWYNVSSFDGDIEIWWYIIVSGGYVYEKENSSEDFELSVYPIPAKNDLFVQYQTIDQQYNEIEIYDVGLRKIKATASVKPDNCIIKLDISQLIKGLYFLHFKSDDFNKVVKFLKQ